MKFILGLKNEMTQIFDEEGNQIPVTVIDVEPNTVLQIKKEDKDGYDAIQVGLEKLKDKKVKKPLRNKPFHFIREFRGEINLEDYKEGQEINVSIFEAKDQVKVLGISKGKGFQGGVKKWGFGGSPASHGHPSHRKIGSIGLSSHRRVMKGKKMPGRMGGKQITTRNLEIVKVDSENNILMIKGAVPGRKGTLLKIVEE
jgi:large subunit ribosomal protein L3